MLKHAIFNSSSSNRVWQKLRINPCTLKICPKDGLKSSPPVCQLPPRWYLQHGEKASAQTQLKDCVNYGLRSTGTYHLVAALLLGSLTQGTFLELLPLECVLHNFFSNRCIFCNLSSASHLSWQNKHTRTASAGLCQTMLSRSIAEEQSPQSSSTASPDVRKPHVAVSNTGLVVQEKMLL